MFAQSSQQPPQDNQQQQQGPWYQNGAVPLGSCVMGVPIYVHWTFFALLGVMLIPALASSGKDPLYLLLIFLLYGPILLITIIIHEFGHAGATKMLGGQVGDMVLWPLGGFVICSPTETVANDLKVAIAGPLTHIPQMAAWMGIFFAAGGGDFANLVRFVDSNVPFVAILASQAFYLNAALFIFNLFVPAYPLDGGRVLAATLTLCGMGVVRVSKATAMVGIFIAGALVIWGVADFINGSPTALFTAAVGFFIFQSSWGLFMLARRDDEDSANNLRSHPVFGQDCYQNRQRNGPNPPAPISMV